MAPAALRRTRVRHPCTLPPQRHMMSRRPFPHYHPCTGPSLHALPCLMPSGCFPSMLVPCSPALPAPPIVPGPPPAHACGDRSHPAPAPRPRCSAGYRCRAERWASSRVLFIHTLIQPRVAHRAQAAGARCSALSPLCSSGGRRRPRLVFWASQCPVHLSRAQTRQRPPQPR